MGPPAPVSRRTTRLNSADGINVIPDLALAMKSNPKMKCS